MRENRQKKAVICGVLVLLIIVVCWTGYRALTESERTKPEAEFHTETEFDYNTQDEISADEQSAAGEQGREGELIIQYLGHSCFFLETGGFSVLIDPYSPQVGYGTLQKEADLVTISHEHMDHNYAEAAPAAEIIRGLTPDGLGWETVSYKEGDISITGIPTYHDEASGKLRGRNTVFVYEIAGIRLAHLGDLGHLLHEGDVEKIAPVDILFIPVGGHYTIDALEARQVVEQLAPLVVVPMHYGTRATRNWPISNCDSFLEGEGVVEKKGNKPLVITKNTLPQTTEIWILDPAEIKIE